MAKTLSEEEMKALKAKKSASSSQAEAFAEGANSDGPKKKRAQAGRFIQKTLRLQHSHAEDIARYARREGRMEQDLIRELIMIGMREKGLAT